MAMNKPMFVVGMLLMIITVAMFLFVEQDLGITPIVLMVIGIAMLGASNIKPLAS
jgi:hypothetical protein